jgi:hypothetical protein
LKHSNSSSAINFQTGTCDELRFFTCQEQAVIRYISWVCKASEWDIEEEFLEVLFGWRDADEGFESAVSLSAGT